ncbi:MAG: sugar phosphate nucleotidyltransferase, partial [Microgenomates group bacterium]
MRKKSRLTITLDERLLGDVDLLVDGTKIRSRSHAIETLVRQGISPRVTEAVLLAGGDEKQSFALTRVSGRPVFANTIENLRAAGIFTVFVCGAKHNQAIKDVFGNGMDFGITLKYIEEKQALGTAGALTLVEPEMSGKSIVVIHDDVISEIHFSDIIEFHLSENTQATIAVKPEFDEESYGQVMLHGNKITEFNARGSKGISIVNMGMYILTQELLQKIPKNTY